MIRLLAHLSGHGVTSDPLRSPRYRVSMSSLSHLVNVLAHHWFRIDSGFSLAGLCPFTSGVVNAAALEVATFLVASHLGRNYTNVNDLAWHSAS